MTSLWTSSLIADSAKSSYWDTQTLISGSTKTYLAASAIHGSMSTLVFTRTSPATLRDDVMEFSWHWAIEAGPGAPAVALTGSQASSIETLMTAWWATMKSWVRNTVTLKEYQWRDFGADYPVGQSGTLKYSPTWRITTVGQAGSNSTGTELPHQVAQTITQTTASRLHWGRSYVVGPTHAAMTTNGRWATSFVDDLVTSTRTMFNGATSLPAITNPWVWSPRYGGLLSIREVHADDIPDVQRRRRDKQVGYRKSLTS